MRCPACPVVKAGGERVVSGFGEASSSGNAPSFMTRSVSPPVSSPAPPRILPTMGKRGRLAAAVAPPALVPLPVVLAAFLLSVATPALGRSRESLSSSFPPFSPSACVYSQLSIRRFLVSLPIPGSTVGGRA